MPSDPVLVGLFAAIGMAILTAIVLFWLILSQLHDHELRLKKLQESQDSTQALIPDDLHVRLEKLEQPVNVREATVRHLAAQSLLGRMNGGDTQ